MNTLNLSDSVAIAQIKNIHYDKKEDIEDEVDEDIQDGIDLVTDFVRFLNYNTINANTLRIQTQ